MHTSSLSDNKKIDNVHSIYIVRENMKILVIYLVNLKNINSMYLDDLK